MLIVLSACKVSNDDRPCKSADETTDAKDRVHCLASIAMYRIDEVLKLKEAEPNCRQKLISPDLIREIYDSFGDVFNDAAKKTFLFEKRNAF